MSPGPVSRGMPTMRDVAREAGVSKALVSIVFRGAAGASKESRRRVLEAAERIGYRSHRGASLLALTRTRQLGIIHDLHNGFHSEIVEAAIASAADAGYRTVLSPRTSSSEERQAIANTLELRCEALLLLGTSLRSDELHEIASSVPLVSIGVPIVEPGIDSAVSNDETGMRMILEHLDSLGHAEIVHIDGGKGGLSARRRSSFLAAASNLGFERRVRVVPGGPTEADGLRAARELLAGESGPTAISTFNDLAALGVLSAAKDLGISVPNQLSVCGYDDSPLSRTAVVDLTTVRQGAHELGAWAARAAIARLDEEIDGPQRLELDPELCLRSTTGPANR